jgi:ATP-dependent helicase/nuclease subunit B
VHRYAVEGAGYLSRPYAQYARTYAPYDHLARVKEWSATAGVEDGRDEA